VEQTDLVVTTDGGPFTLAEGAALVSLRPGSSRDLTLIFEPSQIGRAEGMLRVGTDTFQLRGSGLGSQLTYRYESQDGDVTISNQGIVYVGSAPLGRDVRTRFFIENTGTQSATITNVHLSNGQAGFAIEELPNAPITLGPGESTAFRIVFRPVSVGPANTSLLLGAAVFEVAASGQRPPEVPSYDIISTLERGEPARQATVSLRLAQPYSLPLTGTLSIRVSPNGATIDPAVQFATGGRIVGFRIPANSDFAVFEDGTTTALFQTGTVTGTITFIPSFATLADTDLTPANARTLSLFIPPAPPVLSSTRLINATTTSLELVVNGYVANRQLNRLKIRLFGPDGSVEREGILDVDALSQAWFGSPQSEAYGGTFSLTIPFTSRPGAVRIARAEVSAENSLGASNTVVSPTL
jgi:hypothetical protein